MFHLHYQPGELQSNRETTLSRVVYLSRPGTSLAVGSDAPALTTWHSAAGMSAVPLQDARGNLSLSFLSTLVFSYWGQNKTGPNILCPQSLKLSCSVGTTFTTH
jgi:hypothetical protein